MLQHLQQTAINNLYNIAVPEQGLCLKIDPAQETAVQQTQKIYYYYVNDMYEIQTNLLFNFVV